MKKIFISSLVLTILFFFIHPTYAAQPAISHSQNYTAVLTYGQTPYQVGYLSKSNITGWTWWDTSGSLMNRKQQNLIFINVLQNGTPAPVTGLSPTSWSRTDEKSNTGTYSYKADYDGQGNYSNNADIWHILDDHSTYDPPWEDIDLMNSSSAALDFYTYYEMEDSRDFGYVKISTDRGKTWTELASYTGSSDHEWKQETVDLTPYAGKEVIIAFNFISDSKNVDEGWYIDDISVTSVASSVSLISKILDWITSLLIATPPLFSDDAENPLPKLSVTVEYPMYNHTTGTFSTRQRIVDLREEYQSQGLYFGVFSFENETDTYTGEYFVSFNQPMPDSSSISVAASFNTTLWGCQARGCHDTYSLVSDPSTETPNASIHPNAIVSPGVGGDCQSLCHSPYSSQFLTATPSHLHEIIYGHEGGFILSKSGDITIFNVSSPSRITVTMYSESDIIRPRVQTAFDIDSHVIIAGCKDCHTNFIHDDSGSDEHLIAQPGTLKGTNIISTGVHAVNVTCSQCHRDLSYPSIPDQYSLSGTIGSYDPLFTSYLANTKTYIIDVTDDIDITVDIENPTYGVTLTLIGPVDNTNGLQDLNTNDSWEGTYFVPSIDGRISFKKGSQIFYPLGGLKVSDFTSTPSQGTWIGRLFSWSPGSSNYTITSNNPLVEKPIIHIPWNCSECHNPSGTGNASTNRSIPNWDTNGLSFAHIDFDDDSEFDVPCRSCHNSFHEISIMKCQNCHNAPPPGHNDFIEGNDYFSAPHGKCFFCHGDPHNIGPGGGPNCTECHLEGGSYTNWDGPILKKDGFFNSSHRNITGDFDASNYSRISMVCWGCHVDYAQQLVDPGHTKPASELPICEDCHFSATPLNSDYLRKQPPIQIPEHQPQGEDIKTNISTNCTFCHNNSLSIPIPTTNVKYAEARNYVSHYLSTVYLMTPTNRTTDCMWCHVDNSNNISWGSPPNPMSSLKFNHTELNITNNSGCYPCHVSYKALNNSVPIPGFTFHNENMAAGAGNDCVYCHNIGGIVREELQIDVQAMNQSDAIHYDLNRGAAVTLDANNVRCWACHGDGDGSEAAQPNRHPDNYLPENAKNCSKMDCHNVNQSIFNEPMVYEHFKYVDLIDENISTAVECQDCHKNSVQVHQESIIHSDYFLVSHYGSTRDLVNTSSCIYCHLDEDNAEKWGDAPDPTDNISRPSDKEWENTLFVGDRWHLGNRYVLVFEDIAENGESAYLRLYRNDIPVEDIVVYSGESYTYEAYFIDKDGNEVKAIALELNFTAVFRGEKAGLVKAQARPWKRIHIEDKDPACWACHMDDYVADKKRYVVLDEDEDLIYYVEKLLDFSDEDYPDRMTLIPSELVVREGYSRILEVDGDLVLTVKDIDIKGKQALIILTRAGIVIEEDIFKEGEYLEYEEDLSYNDHDINDQVIFRARFDRIFNGLTYDAVILTDVRVISNRLLAYERDEKLGGYNTSQLHIGDTFSIGGMPDTFHVPPLNEGLDGGPDCVLCHDTSTGFGIASVDAISTQLGGHAGLNENATNRTKLTDTIDKACWACHGDGSEPEIHPPNYLYPRLCRDCHVELNEPNFGAVDISDEAHAQVEDCNRCHAADYPGLHVINVFEPDTPYILWINVNPEIVSPGQPVNVELAAMAGWNMKVQSIEYFIDVEGAAGTGTPLTPKDGVFDEQVEEAEFTIDTGGLAQGDHTIIIRSKQRDDKWGPTNTAKFAIEQPVVPKPDWWYLIIILIITALIILLVRKKIFGTDE